eukprot:CAMPEP_0180300048 /NCGR_PEP_ID=MMETSP0988-20121125/22587_1 /TAXON_ID=697907 /ORGANISM="non described non described, Strain CCMP2293" /LENGTH=207 /DNA_ID=CAMNT_0022280193 /DNA_START=408 /DNA_END=1030 /DNA_ORIENTATION=+
MVLFVEAAFQGSGEPGVRGARRASKAEKHWSIGHLMQQHLTGWLLLHLDCARGKLLVTSLDISANAIGDDGATAIARALNSNSNLKHLDMHACSIRDEGAAALAGGIIGSSSLAAINLRANYIGDRGATLLANAATQSSALRFLVVSSNDFGSPGEAAVARALRENSQLRLEMPRGENDNMLAEAAAASRNEDASSSVSTEGNTWWA